MIRENQKLLNQLNMLTDGAATFAAMLLSYWLRFDVLSGDRALSFGHYVWLGAGAALLMLIVFAVADRSVSGDFMWKPAVLPR